MSRSLQTPAQSLAHAIVAALTPRYLGLDEHLQFGNELPKEWRVPWEIALASGSAKGVYEWELASLAKELFVNSPARASDDLRSWKSFSESVDKLKNLDNSISMEYEALFRKEIFSEMHRHAHHQFGWQDRRMQLTVIRYFKMFSDSQLDSIVNAYLGLSLAGHFLEKSEINEPIENAMPVVATDQVKRFLDLFSLDLRGKRRFGPRSMGIYLTCEDWRRKTAIR
jgi:hypothetical protein